jgi:hypothetical protein
MFLNEPEGVAAEEQPKQWISKSGDVYCSGIHVLRKDIQRTRLAGDFVGSFLMQRKVSPNQPF